MSSVSKKLRKASAWNRTDEKVRADPRKDGNGHRYIRIDRYHRNINDAEKYVLELFSACYPSAYLPKVRDQVFAQGQGNHRFEIHFRDACKRARETGSAEPLRSYLNGADPYFTFSVEMAAEGEGISMQLGFIGQNLKLTAPMRQGHFESELTDDILEHRRLASELSLKGADGFRATAMHIRSYVLSCCALVEAFLNRCVLIQVHAGRRSAALEELQKPCNCTGSA